MSFTDTYKQLHADFLAVLKKHNLDKFAACYTPELINFMLRKQLDKVQKAVDYSSTIQLINDTIMGQMGMKMDITSMISSAADKQALYQVLARWRSTLLSQIAAEKVAAEMLKQQQAQAVQ